MQASDCCLCQLQAALALASTESLLSQIPLFAEDAPLLERVAMLLKPAYALAGAVLYLCDFTTCRDTACTSLHASVQLLLV